MRRKVTRMESKSIKPGVIGLGVGLAVGVAVGMALSPKSGKENRAVVINQYNKAKDATTKKLKRSKKDAKDTASTKKAKK